MSSSSSVFEPESDMSQSCTRALLTLVMDVLADAAPVPTEEDAAAAADEEAKDDPRLGG